MIKSPQNPLRVMINKLKVINDNVRARSREEKRFQTLMEGRQRWSRNHIVSQTVPNGGSEDWEGPAANGR